MINIYKTKLINFIKTRKFLYLPINFIYRAIRIIFKIHSRTILLAVDQRDQDFLTRIKEDNKQTYNGIYEDLKLFTGLGEQDLDKRLLMAPAFHYKSEFLWHNPSNEQELTWFYRLNSSYLFDNAAHEYWNKLDYLKGKAKTVLEYAGGIGHNVIPLLKQGYEVDYFEISMIQRAFVEFRAKRHSLNGLNILSPFINSRFDPVNSITKNYDAIILQDVLEHIPNYQNLLRYLIGKLNPGGYIIEQTPFEEDPNAPEIDIHLKPSISLKEAMTGMESIERNIWRKI